LPRMNAVECAKGGNAMKDFLKAVLAMGSLLTLVLGVRVAAFFHIPDTALATQDSPVVASTDGGCAVMNVKMPCFRQAKSAADALRQSVDSETFVPQDPRCATRAIKMPCLQGADKRG
jgi:hypothetical protein